MADMEALAWIAVVWFAWLGCALLLGPLVGGFISQSTEDRDDA